MPIVPDTDLTPTGCPAPGPTRPARGAESGPDADSAAPTTGPRRLGRPRPRRRDGALRRGPPLRRPFTPGCSTASPPSHGRHVSPRRSARAARARLAQRHRRNIENSRVTTPPSSLPREQTDPTTSTTSLPREQTDPTTSTTRFPRRRRPRRPRRRPSRRSADPPHHRPCRPHRHVAPDCRACSAIPTTSRPPSRSPHRTASPRCAPPGSGGETLEMTLGCGPAVTSGAGTHGISLVVAGRPGRARSRSPSAQASTAPSPTPCGVQRPLGESAAADAAMSAPRAVLGAGLAAPREGRGPRRRRAARRSPGSGSLAPLPGTCRPSPPPGPFRPGPTSPSPSPGSLWALATANLAREVCGALRRHETIDTSSWSSRWAGGDRRAHPPRDGRDLARGLRFGAPRDGPGRHRPCRAAPTPSVHPPVDGRPAERRRRSPSGPTNASPTSPSGRRAASTTGPCSPASISAAARPTGRACSTLRECAPVGASPCRPGPHRPRRTAPVRPPRRRNPPRHRSGVSPSSPSSASASSRPAHWRGASATCAAPVRAGGARRERPVAPARRSSARPGPPSSPSPTRRSSTGSTSPISLLWRLVRDQDAEAPEVRLVRAGPDGIELLLAAPRPEAPWPFLPRRDGRWWVLDPAAELGGLRTPRTRRTAASSRRSSRSETTSKPRICSSWVAAAASPSTAPTSSSIGRSRRSSPRCAPFPGPSSSPSSSSGSSPRRRRSSATS